MSKSNPFPASTASITFGSGSSFTTVHSIGDKTYTHTSKYDLSSGSRPSMNSYSSGSSSSDYSKPTSSSTSSSAREERSYRDTYNSYISSDNSEIGDQMLLEKLQEKERQAKEKSKNTTAYRPTPTITTTSITKTVSPVQSDVQSGLSSSSKPTSTIAPTDSKTSPSKYALINSQSAFPPVAKQPEPANVTPSLTNSSTSASSTKPVENTNPTPVYYYSGKADKDFGRDFKQDKNTNNSYTTHSLQETNRSSDYVTSQVIDQEAVIRQYYNLLEEINSKFGNIKPKDGKDIIQLQNELKAYSSKLEIYNVHNFINQLNLKKSISTINNILGQLEELLLVDQDKSRYNAFIDEIMAELQPLADKLNEIQKTEPAEVVIAECQAGIVMLEESIKRLENFFTKRDKTESLENLRAAIEQIKDIMASNSSKLELLDRYKAAMQEIAPSIIKKIEETEAKRAEEGGNKARKYNLSITPKDGINRATIEAIFTGEEKYNVEKLLQSIQAEVKFIETEEKDKEREEEEKKGGKRDNEKSPFSEKELKHILEGHLKTCQGDKTYNSVRDSVVATREKLKTDPSNKALQELVTKQEAAWKGHPFYVKSIEIGIEAARLRVAIEKREAEISLQALGAAELGLSDKAILAKIKQLQEEADKIKQDILVPLRASLDRLNSPRDNKKVIAGLKGAGESVYDTGKGLLELGKLAIGVQLYLSSPYMQPIIKRVTGIDIEEEVTTFCQSVAEGVINVTDIVKLYFQQAKHAWENPEAYKSRLKELEAIQEKQYLYQRAFEAESYHLAAAEKSGYWPTEIVQLLYGEKIIAELAKVAAKGGKLATATAKAGKLVEAEKVVEGSKVLTSAASLETEASKLLKEVETGKELFNFKEKAARRMQDKARRIPLHILEEIIKSPIAVIQDPQSATNARMYYATIYRKQKLYNAEVLYDKAINTIYHFKYSEDAMGPLKKIIK